MADPLTAFGAAASAAQFVSLAFQILVRLHDYHSTKNRTPKSLLYIQENLPIMIRTCEIAQEQSNRDPIDQTLENFVKQMLKNLLRLDELTQKLLPNNEERRMWRTSKALRSMWKEKDLRALEGDLEMSTRLLTSYLSLKNGQAVSAAPKSIHHLPATNPRVNWERLLYKVTFALADESRAHPRVVVLHGMGGQGKTNLALSVCRTTSVKYDVIVWINALSRQSLQLDFAAGLRAITSSRQSIYDLDLSFSCVNDALVEKTWLIVFDNYDDPEHIGQIAPYFPTNGSGAIIITSRHRDVKALGTAVDVGGMEESEAVELLLGRTEHNKEDPSTLEVARKIVKFLGYLPLAIDQASAYIGERNLPLENFEQHYNNRRDIIFERTPTAWAYVRKDSEAPGQEIPLSVLTTWEISLAHLPVVKTYLRYSVLS